MAFFLPANHPHEYFSNGDVWDTHWITIDGFAAEKTLELFGLDSLKVFQLGDLSVLEHNFRKMHEELLAEVSLKFHDLKNFDKTIDIHLYLLYSNSSNRYS